MLFCPKCGSILMPKKEGTKTIMKCSCGYTSDNTEAMKQKETVKKSDKIMGVVDSDLEMHPVVKAKCEKCGNMEAYNWMQQMRAADEPPTNFFKCTKCKHTWREN